MSNNNNSEINLASGCGGDVVRVLGSISNHILEVKPSLPLDNLGWGVLVFMQLKEP